MPRIIKCIRLFFLLTALASTIAFLFIKLNIREETREVNIMEYLKQMRFDQLNQNIKLIEALNPRKATVPKHLAANLKAQKGQDKYMYETYFYQLNNGTYVEFGARDGIEHSNTYFYDQLGWNGVLIEAIPEEYLRMEENRPNATHIWAAIVPEGSNITEVEFMVSTQGGWSGLPDSIEPSRKSSEMRRITVPARTLKGTLYWYDIFRVHYVTIDTEGSELSILESIPPYVFVLKQIVIDFVQVEVLRYDIDKALKLVEVMRARDFDLVKILQVADDTDDYIFRRKDFDGDYSKES